MAISLEGLDFVLQSFTNVIEFALERQQRASLDLVVGNERDHHLVLVEGDQLVVVVLAHNSLALAQLQFGHIFVGVDHVLQQKVALHHRTVFRLVDH